MASEQQQSNKKSKIWRGVRSILEPPCLLVVGLLVILIEFIVAQFKRAHKALNGNSCYKAVAEWCGEQINRHPFVARYYKLITVSAVIVIIMLTQCIHTLDNRPWPIGVTPINRLINNEMSLFEATEILDDDIETFMRRWDLPGASFAIMRNDSLLYAKGYGYADVEKQIKCDVNHLFRVASVSKLITATAIMKLIEEKQLSLSSKVFGEEGVLNDPLFLDIQDKNLRKITIEHLLRHTGGFSSPIGDPAFSNSSVARVLGKSLPLTLDDMILYAVQNRLKTTPGDAYDYSNLGYIVLGKVIETITDQEYERYMKDSILHPAGCYDIHIGQNFRRNRMKNEVTYYEVAEAEPVSAYDGSDQPRMKSDGGNNVTLLGAAGGWIGSPVELLQFVAAINDSDVKKNILSAETIRTMTYDSDRYKPIGWASVVGSEWNRSGSMAGTSALIKHERSGYTWIFVTNKSSWNGYKLNKYISSQISRSIAKVKEWPARDLFDPSDD